MKKKIIKYGLIGLIIVLGIIQFVPVDRTNPPVTGEVKASDEVMRVLKVSCYDCHSNETEWPFYSKIAPVSWLVASDVKNGRKELNFSEWNNYDAEKKAHKAEEIAEEIREGEMPMKIFLITHPEAKVSDKEQKVVTQWTERIINKD